MVYVDFRLIAATNRNLEQMVAEGRFREDLFHRLGVLELSVPPLRSHADDIPHLIRCFLEEMIGFKQAHTLEVSRQVMAIFNAYTWPGNIRELRNLLASVLYAIEEHEVLIEVRHLPERFLARITPKKDQGNKQIQSAFGTSLQAIVENAERQAILAALHRSGQNRTLAARELQISRSNLYKRMDALGISRG